MAEPRERDEQQHVAISLVELRDGRREFRSQTLGTDLGRDAVVMPFHPKFGRASAECAQRPHLGPAVLADEVGGDAVQPGTYACAVRVVEGALAERGQERL